MKTKDEEGQKNIFEMASKVDEPLVQRLAGLARLEYDADSGKEIMSDLSKILGFVGKLNELDTEGVEPLVYMMDDSSVLREDIPRQEITHEQAMMNVPLKDSDYIKVPKVIRKSND